MSLRITAGVLVGLFLFLLSHILTMTLLEITPDETPSVGILTIYLITESCTAVIISLLITFIATEATHKTLIILIILIGIITAPAILQAGSKWSLYVTYFLVLPTLYIGRLLYRR